MDDMTIEDDIEMDDSMSAEAQRKIDSPKLFLLFQLLDYPWVILVLFSMLILLIIYANRYRRQQNNLTTSSNSLQDDGHNRSEQMELIRERQQKAYQEKALEHAQRKQAKAEATKSSMETNQSQSKYRSEDHNPLTGQSTRGTGDSCTWRPSSRRRPAGG